MKKLIAILILCVTALGAYASYFEVQVPMSSQQQTSVLSQQPLTSGRFQASVSPLDENGRAYSPGQTSSGPRRVGGGPGGPGGDLPPGPFEDAPVAPITDTPWLIILLLGVGYIAYVAYKRRKASK